jgi:hypothetical protein
MKSNKEHDQTVREDRGTSLRRPYETPVVQSFREEEILSIIGPAQAYNGDLPGVDQPF